MPDTHIGETGPQGPASPGGFTHWIGKQFGGGVIFHLWKDNTGVEHGLIAGLTDISNAQAYSNVFIGIGSTAQSTWNGLGNSNAIVAQAGNTNGAAKLCLDWVSGGYSDWYLPAIDELRLLWQNRFNLNMTFSTIVGATPMGFSNYWSSTESSTWSAGAWYVKRTGDVDYHPKTGLFLVRGVRAF